MERWATGGQRLFLVPSLDLVVVTTAGEYDDGSIGRAQQQLLQEVVAATMEHAEETEESSAPPAADAKDARQSRRAPFFAQ